MNFPYFMARHVAVAGKKSFSRLIIRIAIVAVALSMTVMIISTSLIRGFKTEISEKIFAFWGHIHITDTNITRSFESVPIEGGTELIDKISGLENVEYFAEKTFLNIPIGDEMVAVRTKGGVRHVQAFAQIGGIINHKEEFEAIVLKGVSTDFDWENMKDYMVEGSTLTFPDDKISEDIIISQSTAKRLKLGVKDKFIINFVRGKKQVRKRFQICGIYKTGLEEFDKIFALTDLRRVQELLGWPDNEVGGFEVFIDDIDDLGPLNEYIYIEELPKNLFSQTIKDKFPSIFEWLGLQDINEVVILLLMIIVSVINMITALMILILERTNMIGILKAMGSSNWDIRKIFLYYAGYIVAMGLFWGNLIGLGICLAQQHFEFITLSEADYYLSTAPIEINFWTILLLNLGTLLLTVLVLVIPTYLITRVSPVEAIRFK